MSHQKHAMACAAMLLSGVTMPGAASAQSLSPPYQSYSAKFSCGPRAADNDVVKGTYATSINIHNPQSQLNVVFFKKVVIANEEGATRGGIFVVNANEALPPDSAEQVDCPVIYKATKKATTTHIEGFVVIQVPPVSSGSVPALDVVGKYTSRTPAAGFSVTVYAPQSITN
jgi:hypothetical protein